MKAYICGNTGTGKTALVSYFAQFYREINPTFPIYANMNLNISNTIYTEYGFLPSDKVILGNCLVIYDDIIQIENLKPLINFLAVFCRKTNTDILITCQYYTDVSRKVRYLCHYELEPRLTNLVRVKGIERLTPESELIFSKYNPETLNFLGKHRISNILSVVKDCFDTTEIPKIPYERHIVKEIKKFSNSLDELEFNVGLYTKDKRKQEKIIKEIRFDKGF